MSKYDDYGEDDEDYLEIGDNVTWSKDDQGVATTVPVSAKKQEGRRKLHGSGPFPVTEVRSLSGFSSLMASHEVTIMINGIKHSFLSHHLKKV